MKRILGLTLAGVLVTLPMAPATAEPVTYQGLKTMIEGMGYAPNDLSKPGGSQLFEVKTEAGELTIPVVFELSTSGRYIWARALLGGEGLSPDKALEALKRNAQIQPTSFWITSKGALMIGMPIDNRDITPAHLRFVLDKIDKDIVDTQDIWNVADE